MNRAAFNKLAAGDATHVPVLREIMGDLDTPVGAYLKLASGPNSYLFESVEGGATWGRYSIIGLPCREVIRIHDRQVQRQQHGKTVETLEVDDPLAWVDALRQQYRVPQLPELPMLAGGLVGYFGHETIRYIEPRLNRPAKPDPIGNPDILLMVSLELAVFDNLRGRLYLIVHAQAGDADGYDKAQARLDAIEAQLRGPLPERAPAPRFRLNEEDIRFHYPQAEFEAGVERIRQYTRDGDAMQVVLSQRMSLPFAGAPVDLYRALRTLNPSPYLFFIDLGDHQVVGSSPEILVREQNRKITLRPLAGTRPRGATPEEDLALEAELLADPKERAEHLMLIDLGRNDVGRVSKTGTVRLTEQFAIERYSHVMHIVSDVVGELRDDMGPIDTLRATFPAGTLSGAPKVRALEIIDELEPVKRGVYGGAVGYLSWAGNMDTAIAIRTAVVRDGQVHIQAGAGIVADSVPGSEWEETRNKARAVMRAVNLVGSGLRTDAGEG